MRVDDRLRPYITNTLAPVTAPLVTGIIGEEPSKFARTPVLWNAVFRAFEWDAVCLPWDIQPDQLAGFVRAAREASDILGFSVAVPYKVAVVPLLDDLDPMARRIGAVNTVARAADGRLIGYNTDGQGAIDALTRTLPGEKHPFLNGLGGLRVLMLGAGGAARGVAFYLASHLGPAGQLRIVNRDGHKAKELATAVQSAYGLGEGAGDDQLRGWLVETDLVINATVKGQAGWRRLPGGSCLLEPYSSLAAADPALLPADRPLDASATRDWFLASKSDIQANNLRGLDAIATLRPDAACFDLVYTPAETRFLRDARVAGHRVLNGKPMNLAQAADAFARKVLTSELASRGMAGDSGYDRVFDVMARV